MSASCSMSGPRSITVEGEGPRCLRSGLIEEDPALKGIVITHAHQDHWGLVDQTSRTSRCTWARRRHRILKEAAFWVTGLTREPGWLPRASRAVRRRRVPHHAVPERPQRVRRVLAAGRGGRHAACSTRATSAGTAASRHLRAAPPRSAAGRRRLAQRGDEHPARTWTTRRRADPHRDRRRDGVCRALQGDLGHGPRDATRRRTSTGW